MCLFNDMRKDYCQILFNIGIIIISFSLSLNKTVLFPQTLARLANSVFKCYLDIKFIVFNVALS